MYRKRLVFWSACLGMLLFGVVLITLGSIAPALKDKLDLDEISSGTLFAILPFGILAGSLLFGPFADRYGYKMILFISCLLMFVGFEGIAFSDSTGLLQLCIFLTGLGGGIVNGATNAVVSDISDDARSADISLLGVSYGAGALGMPMILGMMRNTIGFESIIAAVGLLTVAIGVLYLFITFPAPKQSQGIKAAHIRSLVSDGVLWLIAFFLFFQSSFEGLINNWTTSYLTNHLSVARENALFALSAYVIGMVVMRLLLGTVLRKVDSKIIMSVSFFFIFTGSVFLMTGLSYLSLLAAMLLTGAGLAAGFPVMLGFTGDRYAGVSGTAFSFVLFVALTGNIMLNYGMGVVSNIFGIKYLPVITISVALMLVFLFILISQHLIKKQ